MTVPVSFAEAQCRSISSRPFQSCIDAFWSLISSIHKTSFPPHASSFYVPSPSEALTPIPGTAPSTHNHWPQSHLHTQWPGSGHPGSPIFSAFYASNVPFLSSTTLSQTLFQNAGTALLDHIGLSILITHSQGGPSGWLLADARPKLVRRIIAIEPAGPLSQASWRHGLVASTSRSGDPRERPHDVHGKEQPLHRALTRKAHSKATMKKPTSFKSHKPSTYIIIYSPKNPSRSHSTTGYIIQQSATTPPASNTPA